MTQAAETEKPISDETLITRSPDLLTAGIDDETVMMDLANGRYYGLDDIGTVVWQRLEAPRRFADLIDSLAAEYEADRAVIAEDVRKLLSQMAEHKVVTLAR